jgi:hypothetical protein
MKTPSILKLYTLCFSDNGETQEVPLTEEHWFRIFVAGRYAGRPLLWFEPVQQPSKRVTMEENLHGTAPQ